MENTLAGRDLLRLLDFSPAEVALVLETAAYQKAAWAAGEHEAPLAGQAVAIILEKPSLRTRNSFEVAAFRLGCHPGVMADNCSAFSRGETVQDTIKVLQLEKPSLRTRNSFEVAAFRLGCHPGVMADNCSAFSRGETVQDTIKVLQNFYECIVLRTFAHSKIEEVAAVADVPVVNALTDGFHPCQILADLLTIREHLGDPRGLTMAYVGDGNNMANTYLEAGALTGMNVRIASPEGYEVDESVYQECVEAAERYGTGAVLELLRDPVQAVSGADIVVTDTWTSMGDEDQHDARLRAFDGYQVNSELMAHARPQAIFMHCLPAHRGEEVTDEVMDGTSSVVYDEAGNRLHAQKAVLSLLMGAKVPQDVLEKASSHWAGQ